MDGSKDFASGTSFAAPYTAGIVAMWLQHKQQLASKEGVPLDTDETSNDAALRGLVATAQGVQDESDSEYLEPVARMGAGRFWGGDGCTVSNAPGALCLITHTWRTKKHTE